MTPHTWPITANEGRIAMLNDTTFKLSVTDQYYLRTYNTGSAYQTIANKIKNINVIWEVRD